MANAARNPARHVAVLPGPGAGWSLAITVDTLVSGVHFPAATDVVDVGYKSLAVNLSDLAAMGAEPVAVQALCESPCGDATWRDAVAEALTRAAQDGFHVDAVVTCADGAQRRVSVQAVGRVPRGQALTRNGAAAGDRVWVSGTPGDAGAGLALTCHELETGPDAAYLRQRLDRPQPRLALGIALRGVASAALDVSDGIAGDAAHIAARSGVGLRIHLDRIPLSAALSRAAGAARARRLAAFAGDDYELLFTAAPGQDDAVGKAALASATPVHCIGEVVAGKGALILDTQGEPVPGAAFEHFRPSGGPR